jgi:hypothetical protein
MILNTKHYEISSKCPQFGFRSLKANMNLQVTSMDFADGKFNQA